MDSYNGRKPILKGNEEKMTLRPRSNINEMLDVLIKENLTKDHSKEENFYYNEDCVLSIPELSKNIKPKKYSRKGIKENIPIPPYEICNFQNNIPNNSNNKEEDISDLAYNNRHRKYELAEKRIKNRENEILQYHLYKIQELEERIRYLEINNLIPSHLQHSHSEMSSTSSSSNNNISSNINNKKNDDNIKEPSKKNKKVKIEKNNKTYTQKKSSNNHTKIIKEKHKDKIKNENEDEDENEYEENENENEDKNKNKNENDDENDIQIIEIINVVDESEYEKLLKNKRRFNAAIEKLLSCRINPYPDNTHKLRRCSRKLKAFGVSLPHSLNKHMSFDDIIIKQNYLNLNLSKHRMSKRIKTTQQQIERKKR